jgi:prophage DNA circulation protein
VEDAVVKAERLEVESILDDILDALVATLEGKFDRTTMEARNAIGFLRANVEDVIDDGELGEKLVECFQLCREVGVTRVAMDGVRRAMIVIVPKTIPGTVLATSAIFLSLAEQARILGETTFASRDDVDAMLATMNAEFEPAENFAATYTADPRVYQALVGLHAALSADLTDRSRPLPRMVRYNFPTRMPSLKLAMRIYSNARRADELRKENRTVHPAFMQQTGRCLSA